MEMTTFNETEDVLRFAKMAASIFAKDKKVNTVTASGHIIQGDLFAVRWGLDGNCVVVFRVSEEFEPINFQDLIKDVEKE